MRSRALLAVLLGGAILPAAVLAQAPQPPAGAPAATPAIAWERDDWNPAAKPDDIVLPLPCKGAIAFRKVVTGPPRQAGKGNELEDRLVTLGGADDPIPYVGYLHSDFIAGGFFAPDGQRYYLIGKYEVTVEQYEAVMGNGECKPTPPERAALPASGVSWYDAVEFTRRLNKWLYSERLDAVPKSAGRPGFVRLPSEVEWEFAARGGLAVSDAERGNPTFVPAGANLSEYAWFAGPESSAGQLKQIGSLKPNPLGLYDMLGNAEEIVLEPFRLNRVGRLHGELGGIVVRGGSYMTPRESIRASARTEFPVFEQTSKSEMRLPTFGFRVVVGATALSKAEQAKEIQKEWDEARRTETSVAGKNPLQLLEGLLKQAGTPAEKAQLQAVIDQFNTEVRQRNELQARAIKSLLSSALIIRSNIVLIATNFDQLHKMGIDAGKPGIQGELAKQAKATLDERKPKFEIWASVYADLIQQLGTDFRAEDVKAQAEELKADLAARGRAYDRPGVDATLADASAFRDGRVRDTGKILRAVTGRRPWLTP
ncbi:MAG: SUMF1/EgtB/PvdO family nonheme iron enzyme [Reyranellales bacterium]